VVDSDLNPTSSGKTYRNGRLVDSYSTLNHIVEISEMPFTIIFTLECILKILAMGLQGFGSYGHDAWNFLDFCVVVARYEPHTPVL
jgi:hypothetical protein